MKAQGKLNKIDVKRSKEDFLKEVTWKDFSKLSLCELDKEWGKAITSRVSNMVRKPTWMESQTVFRMSSRPVQPKEKEEEGANNDSDYKKSFLP